MIKKIAIVFGVLVFAAFAVTSASASADSIQSQLNSRERQLLQSSLSPGTDNQCPGNLKTICDLSKTDSVNVGVIPTFKQCIKKIQQCVLTINSEQTIKKLSSESDALQNPSNINCSPPSDALTNVNKDISSVRNNVKALQITPPASLTPVPFVGVNNDLSNANDDLNKAGSDPAVQPLKDASTAVQKSEDSFQLCYDAQSGQSGAMNTINTNVDVINGALTKIINDLSAVSSKNLACNIITAPGGHRKWGTVLASKACNEQASTANTSLSSSWDGSSCHKVVGTESSGLLADLSALKSTLDDALSGIKTITGDLNRSCPSALLESK